MTQEQWEQVKTILMDALDLEPAEREAYARRAANDDAIMVPELLRLLKENERESDLLSRPILANAKAVIQEEAPRFPPSTFLAKRFRIVRFIARGGMGEVYEAEDVELGEHVALKAIRPRVASDPELRLLFKREIQLARRVTHPNVCRIFDLAQHEDPAHSHTSLLLSMELIEGQTLSEHLRINGPLTFRGAMPLIEDIAAGLQAVHDAGIVHGDLKPGNVMLVTRPGESAPHARVMDFGMAFPMGDPPATGTTGSPPPIRRPSGSDSEPTITLRRSSPALRGGTPDYFAPEQASGGSASTATDVYAFALVICDMLGVPRAQRLHPTTQHMPGRWTRVLRRCLKNDPASRYSRPADVVAALRASVDGRQAKRIAFVALCGVLALLTAARRIDLFRSTGTRLLLDEKLGVQAWAASPDGKSFAATSWDTGDLVLRDVESGKTRRLTHKTTTWAEQFGGAYSALFSPDGRQIAFEWLNSRTDSEIRLIGVDGKGGRTAVHQPDLSVRLVDWSPDGRQLLVWAGEHGARERLALLSTQDGVLRYLEKQPQLAWNGSVMFGVDSQSLIFDAKNPQGDGLEIHSLTLSGQESVLALNTGSSSIVGWTPDRRRLVFFSDRKGHRGVWVAPISDRGPVAKARQVVANATDWERLGISGNASLFYRLDQSSVDVYTAVLDLAAGRTVSSPKRVSERYIGAFAYPSWSEDGRYLVFDSNRDWPTMGLGIYELATGRMRELRLQLRRSYRPQWVEHGAAIIVAGASDDGGAGAYRVDARTGETTLLHSAQEIGSGFEGLWSQDEKVHFNRFSTMQRGIFRLDPAAGERRILYVPPAGIDVGTENLALSPDGRTLAFHARKGGSAGTLMLVPSVGGEARALFTVNSPDNFSWGSFTWTPDGRNILAAVSRKSGRTPGDTPVSTLWRVPVDGSPPTKIDFPPMWLQALRLNPDGKTLAFQVRSSKQEIWVMQNFL
jgi:Tol biopolymer transport system component